jgi:radical SAM protein with 4Fe4S-binding SPASM domain
VLGLSGLSVGKLVYCYAERDNQLIINYNGDVHKCSVSNFRPEDRVGYIRADGRLVRDEQRWALWTDAQLSNSTCRACSYLPLCMGGCRKTRLEQEGPGDCCTLVPTNASYLLKQIAYGRFPNLVQQYDPPMAVDRSKS